MFDTAVRATAGIPDPAQSDDAGLIDAICAWERIAAWAAAGQAAAIAELARRRPRCVADGPAGHLDAGDRVAPEVSEFAVDELAAALHLSRLAAGARLHLAVELSRLPAVAAALADGDLDVPRARVVTDAVVVLDAPAAVAVADRVLPRAGGQTTGQLRASLSRAVLAIDPAAADRRHERAVADRQVALRPARDGMAELWALLPAESAVAIYQHVDEQARRSPRDGRGMDARRADALVTAVLVPAVPCASPSSVVPSPVVPAAVVVPSPVVPAAVAVRSAASSPVGGGPVAVGPVPARTGSSPAAVGSTAVAPVVLAAGVHVTVPLETAVGVGDEPGHLAGYGPVPASAARRIAGAATAWRRVVTDPATGAVTDVGRTAYLPSAALADLVRTRDRTCRFPGCRQPARRCDLDHVMPWPEGPTTAANLAVLCRHHHRLKHQAGWTVRGGPAGTLTWISPTGHRHPVEPVS